MQHEDNMLIYFKVSCGKSKLKMYRSDQILNQRETVNQDRKCQMSSSLLAIITYPKLNRIYKRLWPMLNILNFPLIQFFFSNQKFLRRWIWRHKHHKKCGPMPSFTCTVSALRFVTSHFITSWGFSNFIEHHKLMHYTVCKIWQIIKAINISYFSGSGID